jgi:site-specific recombinase XerD
VLSSFSDVQVRLRRTTEDIMEEATKWIERWKYEIAPKPSRPGVWRLRGGGYLVRGRVTDFRTGKQREVMRAVKDTDAAGAYRLLQEALDEARSGTIKAPTRRMRFSEYAASLFERKVLKGEIDSAQTRENWELMLRLHLFPEFGDVYVDAISKGDVESWLARAARLEKSVKTGEARAAKYSPTTVNNWLRLLKAIMNEAVDELGLEKNPLLKVKGIDTSSHVTYTEEEPNALTPEEVHSFLRAMRDRQPQHFAMVALGFATGWRPSMMRPLRRKGVSADVLWDTNVVLARRSQTRGDEVREATKNSTRFRVTLPPDVMTVLRWHADRLPPGLMRESDLLFPSETGGFRSSTVLDKPFKDVCQHLSLGKRVTPKAMRRTFQDLARRAAVDGLVQRSICGHLTEEMTERYSSVAQAEVEAALGKVVSLAGYRGLLRKTGGGKRSGGKVVGKSITTPATAAASPPQVPATN